MRDVGIDSTVGIKEIKFVAMSCSKSVSDWRSTFPIEPENDLFKRPRHRVRFFATKNPDQIYENALSGNADRSSGPANIRSPCLDARRTRILRDADGFPIEVFKD